MKHKMNGKSYNAWLTSIEQAMSGKVVMLAYPDNINLALIDWAEYERLKKLDTTPQLPTREGEMK